MKIAIFGKLPISENKSILKIAMSIPNKSITRKAYISVRDSFFNFTNPYGKYLHIIRPQYGPGVDSVSNKWVPSLFVCKLTNKNTITKAQSSTNTQTQYVPGKHDSNINIQTVYTATTQIYFLRIVKIMILPHLFQIGQI